MIRRRRENNLYKFRELADYDSYRYTYSTFHYVNMIVYEKGEDWLIICWTRFQSLQCRPQRACRCSLRWDSTCGAGKCRCARCSKTSATHHFYNETHSAVHLNGVRLVDDGQIESSVLLEWEMSLPLLLTPDIVSACIPHDHLLLEAGVEVEEDVA